MAQISLLIPLFWFAVDCSSIYGLHRCLSFFFFLEKASFRFTKIIDVLSVTQCHPYIYISLIHHIFGI